MLKRRVNLIHPTDVRSKTSIKNMFRQQQSVQQDQISNRPVPENYDMVGPIQFRTKLIHKFKPAQDKQRTVNTADPRIQTFNQTGNSKKFTNSTINRRTMYEHIHKDQQIQVTKQQKTLQRHKKYCQIWDKRSQSLKNMIGKKSPILMQSNIKPILLQPNQNKIDTINEYIVHYWEMSLRNNNPILERHIKGHHFQKLQKQKLLQMIQGTKKVQNSIPLLPLEKLKKLGNRQLSLSGRNKIKKQSEQSNSSYKNSERYSIPLTTRVQQEEVFKINYEGNLKWLGNF